MKLTSFTKTIFCLALALSLGSWTPSASAQSEDWRYIAVIAPMQTVEVHTSRGEYTANFETIVLVYPDGKASGLLTLSRPDSAGRSNQGFGKWEVTLAHVLDRAEGKYLSMRARPLDRTPGDEITVVISPDSASEPCRIYDIVGTQVNALHFEAQTRFEVVPH
jgi:hypothetical protein